MLLLQRTSFLVIHDHADGRAASVQESLQKAVASWTPGSRLSPIWPIEREGNSPPATDPLEGDQTLTFLGPVAPAKLTAGLEELSSPGAADIWVTAGWLPLNRRQKMSPQSWTLQQTHPS